MSRGSSGSANVRERTRRLTVLSSLRTWSNADIGARKMMASTLSKKGAHVALGRRG